MTPKRSKPKRGRPATGRDPLLSIRIPPRMLSRLAQIHRDMLRENNRITISKIAREAINIGLDHISGEKPFRGMYLPPGLRPKHAAEIHEAGHAVAMFLFGGDDVDDDPGLWVKRVTLRARSGGATYWGDMLQMFSNPKHRLWVLVAGAVADALDTDMLFWEVWNLAPCSRDRRDAAKLGFTNQADIINAAGVVRKEFEKLPTWGGLLCLARGLTHGSRTGSQCWNDFKYGRENWRDFALQIPKSHLQSESSNT